MTAAISHPTLRLIRVEIGDYKIDKLLPGDFLVVES
jgi:16S rRNA U516 pseudouridylate synthase RsuA-like enzyme